ncbi:MAG: hypothetical protein ABI597_04475 [Gammaproteobacteria bacterium]
MTDTNGKKRKFLKPIEFAVAALLSIALPATAATVPSGVDGQASNPIVNPAPQVKHSKQKQLLVKPSDQKNKEQLAGHYSHSSHSSHSSHYSSSR